MSGNGIVEIAGHRSVDETVANLKNILEAKGVTLFAFVDHSGEAIEAGFAMRPTKLLIFGSPKAGTPLMLASPSAALDLPLKILVREDERGETRISYNAPEYLMERHDLPAEFLGTLSAAAGLAAKAAE